MRRIFTENLEKTVYETVPWGKRDVKVLDTEGNALYEGAVNAPANWSDRAVSIAASKYFCLDKETGERESCIAGMIKRVVDTIVTWGKKDNYFEDGEAEVFEDELTYMLLHQMASFNSPVWFNFGAKGHLPQGAACFLLGVEDHMSSIMTTANTMANIFKFGSGAGANLSKLRSSAEELSGGGKSSGPISFSKIYNSVANVVKSGGVSRRAAILLRLDDDHYDIEDFINCKKKEELIAHFMSDSASVLSELGSLTEEEIEDTLRVLAAHYHKNKKTTLENPAEFLDKLLSDKLTNRESIDFANLPDWTDFSTNPAYNTVNMQNVNISVGISDRFMSKVASTDDSWELKARNGKVLKVTYARALLRAIAEAAWYCGDPGVQFDDTINKWFMGKEKINTSNPCSEVFLPDFSSEQKSEESD
jgi:ribonucleoside-diphosphate reductase alpha chain